MTGEIRTLERVCEVGLRSLAARFCLAVALAQACRSCVDRRELATSRAPSRATPDASRPLEVCCEVWDRSTSLASCWAGVGGLLRLQHGPQRVRQTHDLGRTRVMEPALEIDSGSSAEWNAEGSQVSSAPGVPVERNTPSRVPGPDAACRGSARRHTPVHSTGDRRTPLTLTSMFPSLSTSITKWSPSRMGA